MISTTILCEVVTADGTAAWRDPWAGPGYRTFQACPPDVFGTSQPGRIPITINHDAPVIGHLDYLEAGLGYGNGGLFAVGVVEGIPAALIDGQVQCSPEITADAIGTTVGRGRDTRSVGTMHTTRATLDAVSLVDRTAALTSTKVRAWHGDYRQSVDRGRWDPRTVPPILTRAIAAASWNLRYRRPDRLEVHRPPEPEYGYRGGYPARMEIQHSAPHHGVLAVRSA